MSKYPGGKIAGIPAFNEANRKYVQDSNHKQRMGAVYDLVRKALAAACDLSVDLSERDSDENDGIASDELSDLRHAVEKLKEAEDTLSIRT